VTSSATLARKGVVLAYNPGLVRRVAINPGTISTSIGNYCGAPTSGPRHFVVGQTSTYEVKRPSGASTTQSSEPGHSALTLR
jgi:hypothetical protein